MARWIHASSRRIARVFLSGAVLAGAAVSAHASGSVDPVTGLSLDLCVQQNVDRTKSFQSRSGLSGSGWEWKKYQCVASCTPATLTSCSHLFYDVHGLPVPYQRPDGSQHQMQSVDFVVDNMGGSIVYTPDGDTTKTVVFHGGVGGTAYAGSQLSAQLLSTTTAMVVWISWLDGASGVFGTGKAGWFTRQDATGVTIKTQSKRPATVIRWVHDNVALGSAIGTAACSMGTVATLSPDIWWQSDSDFKYQQFIGGPANWNVNASCGKGGPIANGICDSDPLRQCNASTPCSGSGDTCNRPTDLMANEFYGLMNYLADIPSTDPAACHNTNTTPYSLYNDSSFNPRLNPGTFALSHPVDFLTDEMTTSQTGISCPAASLDDHCMGLGSEEYVFHEISVGSQPITMHWNDDPNGGHCQSWVDGTGMAWLLAGMGL